jgi:hypothetical protein
MGMRNFIGSLRGLAEGGGDRREGRQLMALNGMAPNGQYCMMLLVLDEDRRKRREDEYGAE